MRMADELLEKIRSRIGECIENLLAWSVAGVVIHFVVGSFFR